MTFLTNLLFGILKKGAEWLTSLLLKYWRLMDDISSRNEEIDKLIRKHEALAEEVKKAGDNATEEQKQKLIDSARNIIRG